MPTTLPERPKYMSQRRGIYWIVFALLLVVIATGLYLTSSNPPHDGAETNAGLSAPEAAQTAPANERQAQTGSR